MDMRLSQALSAARGGQTKQAQVLLTQLLQDEPNNPQAWFLLGNLVDDAAQKQAFLEKALVLNPTHEMAQMQLAEMTTAVSPPLPAATVTVSASDDVLAQSMGDTVPGWMADDADHLRLDELDAAPLIATPAQPDGETPADDVPDWLQEPAIPTELAKAATAASPPVKAAKAATGKTAQTPAKPKPTAKKRGQERTLTFALYALVAVAAIVTIILILLIFNTL